MAPSTTKAQSICYTARRPAAVATHHQDAAVPRIMKLKAIIVAGMLLAAFALGAWVGSRLRHKASVTALYSAGPDQREPSGEGKTMLPALESTMPAR